MLLRNLAIPTPQIKRTKAEQMTTINMVELEDCPVMNLLDF
jgi:hypothetical protein